MAAMALMAISVNLWWRGIKYHFPDQPKNASVVQRSRIVYDRSNIAQGMARPHWVIEQPVE